MVICIFAKFQSPKSALFCRYKRTYIQLGLVLLQHMEQIQLQVLFPKCMWYTVEKNPKNKCRKQTNSLIKFGGKIQLWCMPVVFASKAKIVFLRSSLLQNISRKIIQKTVIFLYLGDCVLYKWQAQVLPRIAKLLKFASRNELYSYSTTGNFHCNFFISRLHFRIYLVTCTNEILIVVF